MLNTSLRRLAPAIGVSFLLLLGACGGGSSGSKVASLGNTGSGTTTTLSAKSTQDAILAYAACMRTNGVPMQDPTFDANGNMTGGGIGRNSGVDRTSAAYQTAQTACRPLIAGIRLGGGNGANFNRAAIQTAMNDYTACLRNQGLDVKDITLPAPGSRNGGGTGGGNTGSTILGGGGGGGDAGPNGSFTGTRPSFTGTNTPGGTGFNPTTRLIAQLGLDQTDPKVVKAMSACQSILTTAFTNATTTTTAG